MSFLNLIIKGSPIKDNRKQQEVYEIPYGGQIGPSKYGIKGVNTRGVDPVFENYLRKYGTEGMRMTKKGGLYDSNKGQTWYTNGRLLEASGRRGNWDPKTGKFLGYDKASNWIEPLYNLYKNQGAKYVSRNDGTYALQTNNGMFFGDGYAIDKNNKRRKYDLKTGTFLDDVTKATKTENDVTKATKTGVPTTKTGVPTNKISFKTAWQNARNAGNRFFTFRGKSYNTLAENEDKMSWLTNFKDNNSSNSNYNVQGIISNVFKPLNKEIGSQIAQKPIYNYQVPTVDKVQLDATTLPSTQTTYNRAQTRDYLRKANINPYDLTGSERGALRHYLNGDTNYDTNLVKNLNTKYNLGFKFQQGGQINMNNEQIQQAFLQYLAQQTGAKSQQELEQVIQQMGEDGLKQAYAQFMQAMQEQQVQAAKFGAKLNYIKKLNGQCPEGMEMHYYKQGGRLCRKCMAMEAQGGTVDQPVGNAIEQFKAAVGRNKKKFGNKYDADQLAGRKPVGKDSKGRDLYLDGDGNARPIAKHSCGSKIRK